jgi:hypothetical protein
MGREGSAPVHLQAVRIDAQKDVGTGSYCKIPNGNTTSVLGRWVWQSKGMVRISGEDDVVSVGRWRSKIANLN